MSSSRPPSTNSSLDIVQHLVAHRGANNDAPGNTLQQLPENTLPALQEAYQKGFLYVECDVHRTSDGKIIVLHDDTLYRTARFNPRLATSLTHQHFLKIRHKNVSTLLFDKEIAQVDVGAYAPRLGDTFQGTRISLLSEFLNELAKSANRRLIIEVKPGHHEIIDDLVALIKIASLKQELQMDQLLFISFDYSLIAALKAKQPSYKHLLLTVSAVEKSDPDSQVYHPVKSAEELAACLKLVQDARLDGIDLEYDADFIKPDLVNLIHAQKLIVAVWTYMKDDSAAMVKSMLAAGVDLINTNQPESIMTALKSNNEASVRFTK